jgi:DNA-binding MarR family transcriptional regulator
MTDWNPMLGKQTGSAWRAIAGNLCGREYGSDRVCITLAIRAGGIKRKTAKNLIREAIRHGYLNAEPVRTTRGDRYLRIRLTEAGRNLDGAEAATDRASGSALNVHEREHERHERSMNGEHERSRTSMEPFPGQSMNASTNGMNATMHAPPPP